MTDSVWRTSLVLALYQNRSAPASRFVQLATVRADGRPANRTVVFRGFWKDTPQITFVSDARSLKVQELRQSSWAEVCWYFPNTHEQFRIGGPVAVIGDDASDGDLAVAREHAWRELGEPVRMSFNWPAPGQPRAVGLPFQTERPDPSNPVPNFCLLMLDPQEVDHLEINGNPQNRWQFRRDAEGDWRGAEVNP